MHPAQPFPRLLSAVTALHWSALFGTMTVGALEWLSGGQGTPSGRLAGLFLVGPLARNEAAFVLAVVFAVLMLAFLWAAVTAYLSGLQARDEFREVAQVSFAAGVAVFSATALLSVFAGTTDGLTLSLAAIAALLGSAAAIGVTQERAQPSALLSRAQAAAAQVRPVYDHATPLPRKDR